MLYSQYMTHLVQSPEWGEFKSSFGTPAVRVGIIQYTKHKIPFTNLFYGYCPKVNPSDINWKEIEKSAKENHCININFDVPNVLKGSSKGKSAVETLQKNCRQAPKSTFARHNILLDITKSEEEILGNMHTKHRYNISYAQRKGVRVEKAKNQQDFEDFYNLTRETVERQKFYTHPKSYFQKIWDLMNPKGICHILIGKYENEALAAWLFFTYEGILYYPYGGSSEKHKNLQASSLIAWEGIKLGKKLGCHTFDMWGASDDPNDKSDPWYGFTNFKLRFGGRFVEYIDSYDLVVNKPMYYAFGLANFVRWKILNLLK